MKYRAFMFSLAVSITPALAIAPQTAAAQDACSVEDVDDALNQLSCFADGVYLAPSAVADSVSQICYDEFSEDACRSCFSRARRKLYPAFKGLGRLGIISREFASNVRDAIDFAEDETCYLADDWPWDSGDDDSNDDSASRRRQRGRSGKEEDGAQGRAAAATRPRSSIGGRGAETRQLVEDLCPCNSPRWRQEGGQSSYLSCTDKVTDILTRHGKIDSRRAKELRSQLQRSECGR